jgi:hypothetical protein
VTAVWRRLSDSRFLRGVVVGSLATLALVGGVATWAYTRASASECTELPREDLSLREMGQLHRRIEKYKHRERPSPLILSGREASFLLREEFGLPAWLSIDGSEVRVVAQVEEGERCWGLGYRGQVELEHGAVNLQPDELTIGRLDVSWLVRGRTFVIPVGDPPAEVDEGPRARLRDIAGHLLTMQVADGSVFVRVDDPTWIR